MSDDADMSQLLLPQWQEPTPEMLARRRDLKRRQVVGIIGGVIAVVEDLARASLRPYPALLAQWHPFLVAAFVVAGVMIFGSVVWEIVAQVQQRRARAAGKSRTT
jgi:hypothetical protein